MCYLRLRRVFIIFSIKLYLEVGYIGMSVNKNSFMKQAGVLAIAGILCRVIGILYRSPLTSIIGDEGNGYYSTAYNIYVIILLLSSYSIPSAISKEIAQKLALNEYKNAQRIFYCAIIYVVFVGGLGCSFAFFCADLLVGQNSVLVLRAFAPTIFLSGLLGVLRGYFQAHQTMIQTSISQIVEQILNAICSIGIAYLLMRTVSEKEKTIQAIYGATGSAVGTGVGVIVALLFMWYVYIFNRDIIQRRIRRDKFSQVEPYRKLFRNIFFTVTPIIFSTFIYNFSTSLNQTLYTKVLLYFKGFKEAEIAIQYGIFAGKAVVIANIPIAIATAVSAAMLPSVTGSYVKGNIKETNSKVDTAICTTMLISIPAAVGLAVLSRPVVQALFPQKDSLIQASLLLKCISITVVFYSLSTITNSVLQGIGKVNQPVINAFISLVIQTAVLIFTLFFTNLNLYGLAIAAIVYSFFMCVLNGISVHKVLGYKQSIKKNFVIPFIAASGMGLVANFSYKLFYIITGINIISLLISVIFAIVVYFFFLVRLGGISKEEIRGIIKR